MENFVLYDEVGKGKNNTVYKGRRKGTVNFSAIHCIEKVRRPQTTNLVRLTHEIDHKNVVKFHEWYETSNHLWLVVELCTGGNLRNIIEQDGCLPENSIRCFCEDIIPGLHHIHSLGIIFADIKPSSILLDGPGILKFADFGLSRLEEENLDNLFQQFAEAGETWTTGQKPISLNTKGSLIFTSPELIQGKSHSIASDLWALGILLYEMFTGHPPFLAESGEELKQKILYKDPPPLSHKDSRRNVQASLEFTDLVFSLLKKKPSERLEWPALIEHKFWNGQLLFLKKEMGGSSIRDSIRQSVASFQASLMEGSSLHRSDDEMDGTETKRSITSGGIREGTNVAFTVGTRPQSAGTSQLTMGRLTHRGQDAEQNIEQFIFHSSDFYASPIMDNPKITKPTLVRFDHKSIGIAALSIEQIEILSENDRQAHINNLMEVFGKSGSSSPRLMQVVLYLTSIALSTSVATCLLNRGLLTDLMASARDTQQVDMRAKVFRLIGLLARSAQNVSHKVSLSEPIALLTELTRENLRSSKVKETAVPALGEMIFLVAREEEAAGKSVALWSIPAASYSYISSSLRDSEDPTVNHFAAKTIENVAQTHGFHMQKFLTNEVGQLLWKIFTVARAEALRVTAISALARLSRHSAGPLQSLLDTAGVSGKLLQSLAPPTSRVHQSLVTLLGALLVADGRLFRDLKMKQLIVALFKLFESPSTVIRGKVYVLLKMLMDQQQHQQHQQQQYQDVLHLACQSRLVMYIERDSRRLTPSNDPEKVKQVAHLEGCMKVVIKHLLQHVPLAMAEAVRCFASICGRKHPSAAQRKQLKSAVTTLPVVQVLISSHLFRTGLLSQSFMKNLSNLLDFACKVADGDLCFDGLTATVGYSDHEFTGTVFAIVESVALHPAILCEFHQIFVDMVLPSLAHITNSVSGDFKGVALRLFSEVACMLLETEEFEPAIQHAITQKIHAIMLAELIPRYDCLLLAAEPLPCCALKILQVSLENSPSFSKEVEKHNLMAALMQVYRQHEENFICMTIVHLTAILSSLLQSRDFNINTLIDQDIIQMLSESTASVCRAAYQSDTDIKISHSILFSLLDCVHSLLKFVSEIVRRALQAKKLGQERDSEEAETMLIAHKPLTDLTSCLTIMLNVEDSDLADLALRSLSLLVQLFGGESSDAMSPENMKAFGKALKNCDFKIQKIILKIIKRLITTDKLHESRMREEGHDLARIIKLLVDTASSQAEVALSGLANEILQSTGHT